MRQAQRPRKCGLVFLTPAVIHERSDAKNASSQNGNTDARADTKAVTIDLGCCCSCHDNEMWADIDKRPEWLHSNADGKITGCDWCPQCYVR